MFGSSPQNAANLYSKVNLETGVLAADPHQLITLLFDGAIQALNEAAQHMAMNNTAEKGRLITRAISIIENGLRGSLNKKAGGEIAQNLEKLYTFFAKELVIANCNDDAQKLAEIKKLLTDIRSAWLQIAPAKNTKTEKQLPPVVDTLSPRNTTHFSA